MTVFFLFACKSQYSLQQFDEKNPTGEEENIVAEDSAIIESDEPNELESEELEEESNEPSDESIEEPETEEPVQEPDYCTPFDNFSDWNYFGDGNWHIENNLLYENQGGYYATTAYLYDFGYSSYFAMEVEAQWEGNLNDLSGFVFNLDPQTGRHWTATIDDPQGDYGRYSPNGAILISQCLWDECTIIAQDSGLDMHASPNIDTVQLKMEMIGEHILFYWNGTLAFSQTIPHITGPGTVGLYSNDNDGGVIYDNFCITVE